MARLSGSIAALAFVAGGFSAPMPANAANILPTVGTTLRTCDGCGPNPVFVGTPDGTTLGTLFDIKGGPPPPGALDDRTVLEFDVSGLPAVVPMTTLDIDLFNLDPGGPAGTIEVYSYFGNGIITVDEHAAGTFFTSFNLNTSQLLRIDVTSLVQNAINANQQYVGFRLSTPGGPDRYATGPASGLPYPLLNVVPEPSSIALLLTGVTALFGRRRMRMHPLL